MQIEGAKKLIRQWQDLINREQQGATEILDPESKEVKIDTAQLDEMERESLKSLKPVVVLKAVMNLSGRKRSEGPWAEDPILVGLKITNFKIIHYEVLNRCTKILHAKLLNCWRKV